MVESEGRPAADQQTQHEEHPETGQRTLCRCRCRWRGWRRRVQCLSLPRSSHTTPFATHVRLLACPVSDGLAVSKFSQRCPARGRFGDVLGKGSGSFKVPGDEAGSFVPVCSDEAASFVSADILSCRSLQ